jgi:hypothetical protein
MENTQALKEAEETREVFLCTMNWSLRSISVPEHSKARQHLVLREGLLETIEASSSGLGK